MSQVRAYELSLLRRKVPLEEGSCNKDDRKGVGEIEVARKSSGILVAVTPCLQIVSIKPMYAAESLTQVVILVLCMLTLFQVRCNSASRLSVPTTQLRLFGSFLPGEGGLG